MRQHQGLSKRERQMVEVIYRMREADAAQVQAEIPDPPGYSSVRTTLNILVQKGLLSVRRVGRKYLYTPVIPRERARLSALKQTVQTYFDNSILAAVSTLLRSNRAGLAEEEYASLLRLIDAARKKG